MTETPFDRSTIRPDRMETLIASLIWIRRGRGNPVSIAEIIRLANISGLGERMVKSVVEQLVVTHRCRIGARRDEPAGYFWIETAEDQAAAVNPYKAQILSMLRRLRVFDSPEDYRVFLGQLSLEGGE